MKIKEIRTEEAVFPLKRPFVTALRRVDRVRALHLEILCEDGSFGRGAAAPVAAVTGETMGSLREATALLGKSWIGRKADNLNELLADLEGPACGLAGNPGAKAALDMALHDLFTRRAGLPLTRFLGGALRSIRTDLTISLGEPEQMARDAAAAEAEGFSVLKIKLGRDWREDLVRFRGIARRVSCPLRIDANQGWNLKGALAFMEACGRENLPVDLLEQPLPARDHEGMAFLRERIPCPLGADEAVFSPEDALKIIEARAADVINIKLLKAGGLGPARKIAALAEAAGLACMIGCMMESPLGIAAALHFACAAPGVRFFDLDLPHLLKELPPGLGLRRSHDQQTGTPLLHLSSEL